MGPGRRERDPSDDRFWVGLRWEELIDRAADLPAVDLDDKLGAARIGFAAEAQEMPPSGQRWRGEFNIVAHAIGIEPDPGAAAGWSLVYHRGGRPRASPR